MLRSTIGSLCLCACALSVSLAHAQTAVYVEGGLAEYGFAHLNNSDFSSKGDTGGIGGGVFYNFPIQSRATFGLVARVNYSPGYKGGVLGGGALRVGFVPTHNPLRPFFELGGSVVHSGYHSVESISNGFSTSTVVVSHSVNNGAAQFVIGLDVRLTDHVDLRAPELSGQGGAGRGVQAGSSFLNAGVVYHLRPKH